MLEGGGRISGVSACSKSPRLADGISVEIKVSTSTAGLDRPKNRYGRCGFPSFYNIFISSVGVDGARVCL